MRVLMLHNRYRQRGGEDAAVELESQILERHGVEVIRPAFDNAAQGRFPILGALDMAVKSNWSRDSYETVRQLCRHHRPDVVHVHNFWMRLSPSVHAAAHDSGVPTVQSLHNHRLSCVNGMMLRNGRHCEDCVGHSPWRGVLHRCQHGSLIHSAAVARMIVRNRRLGTWQQQVDAFIVPSRFARSQAIAGNLPAARTFVKPNATADPGKAPMPAASSSTAVFAGRLSEEKGIGVLLEAQAMAGAHGGRWLLIVGDGPARAALESRARALGLKSPQVVFTGWKSPAEVADILMKARFSVLPSLCAETFGTSVVEAFACGRPAIVTAAGGQSEIVDDGDTGLQVTPGDAGSLARAMEVLHANDALVTRMSERARTQFLARYTPEQSYRKLVRVYEFAVSRFAEIAGVGCWSELDELRGSSAHVPPLD